MDFNGKHILITGAAGGIGSVLCERLKEQGAKLSVCGKSAEKMQALVASLGDICAGTVDITEESQVAAFYREAFEKNGKIDALVNLAGLSIPAKIPETPEDAYDLMMDVNVKGTFLTCKHFPQYAAKPSIIINIGSMAARTANPNAPLYCTAKAAVNMLSKGLLLQLGSEDIRVTTINPGGVDTPFWGNRTVDKTKLMQAEEVVDVIMFVLSSSPKIQIHNIDFESKARF